MESIGSSIAYCAAAIGLALVVLAASSGIRKIGSSAMEGTARQPEAASDLRTSMVIACALIEGIAFLGIITCLLIVLLK